MSQENVEIVREGIAAFSRGDVDAFVQVGHADIAFRGAGRLPGMPSVNGIDGVRAWCQDLFSAFELELHPSQFVEMGNVVVAEVRMVALGKRSGLRLDQTLTFAWHLRAGLVTEFDAYATRAEALEAVGLREY